MSEVFGNNLKTGSQNNFQKDYFKDISKYQNSSLIKTPEGLNLTQNQNQEIQNLQNQKEVEKGQILQEIKTQINILLNELNNNITQENEEISSSQAEKYIQTGKQELEIIENETTQIEQKILRINLISDVSGMYKEYLQSILQNIKWKSLHQKDERYETQINIIQENIEFLGNLVKYLETLKNYDELKNLDINQLVNNLLVSEENLAKTGFIHQPIEGIWNKKYSVDGVNKGYEEIKNLLLSKNLTSEKSKKIKLMIFDQIRNYDYQNVDDSFLLNSGDAISQRIIPDVLENKNLKTKQDINFTFNSLQSFGIKEKQELFNAFKQGKESFINSLYGSQILSKLKFKKWKRYNSIADEERSFLNNLFDSINNNLKTINGEKTKEEFKRKIENEFSYLLERIPKEKKEEILEIKKVALQEGKISELVENLKLESSFAILEKAVINKTLENNSNFVYKIAQNDTAIKLYKDIEGIGSDFSDKTVNNIISTSSFLIEQIVIMYVSGFVGGLLVKGLTTMKLATIGVNSSRLGKFCIYGGRVGLEGAGFYGTYTGVNGIVNEKELKEIFLNYNFYDLAKTIIFLGILRSLPLEKLKQKCNIENNRFLNEIKDITLDTGAVFGTDITIKGVESLVQQGGINFEGNIGEFLVEEISFIIPLVIGLRQADKAVNRLFDGGKKPEITANLGKDEVTITFTKGGEGEIRRSIGRLKQHRNILRNKGKSVKNINKEIAGKKKELKEVRNGENTQQEKSGDNGLEMRPIQPKDTKTESQKDGKGNNENKAKENVDSNARMEKMTGQIIEDVLKGNVEDVMRGFKESGVILPKFRELINKGELEQVKELIGGEIDLEVRRLQGEGVKVTDEGRKFVEEFKEKRVVEFERLTEIRKDGKEIQGEVKMNFKGNEWILKLKNVKEMEEYFEKLAKKLEENNRSKPNNLIIKK